MIEKSLTEQFPQRAPLIRAAFGAHWRQEYELSIPVLLAQTDNGKVFLPEKKQQTASRGLCRTIFADAFKAALLSPLSKTLPIGASQGERSPDTELLNRHTVLHGESFNYGTRTNSLKAISLINYVAHVLSG